MNKVWIWAASPNRHTNPLLDQFRRQGKLAGVFYQRGNTQWRQLGDRPTLQPDELIVGADLRLPARVLETCPEDCHLFLGFAAPLLKYGLNRCARKDLRYFLQSERLSPRSPLSVIKQLRSLTYRFLLRSVSGCFALGIRAAMDYVRLGVPPEKILPGIYPGPTTETVPNAPRSRSILYVGRLIARKGLSLLADAVSASPCLRTCQLRIVGSGPEESNLRMLFSSRGLKAEWLGELSTSGVLDEIGRAAVLAVPSLHWEGWGYVVNEALASGTLVVASDIVGARELIAAGVNGRVFRSGNPGDLAAALIWATQATESQRSPGAKTIACAFEPETVSGYMLECMLGQSQTRPSRAPWLEAIRNLGGSPDTSLWDSFHNLRAATSDGGLLRGN